MIDAIDKGSCSAEHPSPLLFIHGAWHGAWCWDEHFLDYFAAKGYRVVAVNLLAHGGRPSSKKLSVLSRRDHVADIASVASGLPAPPVLVGHSMGGYLTQRYLETHSAPAAVLVASVPPRGASAMVMRWTRRRPCGLTRALATGNSHQLLDTPEDVRRKFFTTSTPDSIVSACAARLQNEGRRVSLDMMFRPPKPKLVTTPMLVLGGGRDDCFLPREVRATAAAYGTDAVMFPDLGHNLMLEPGWQDVADHIDRWLVSRKL